MLVVKKPILYVDDQVDTYELVALMAQALGYETINAPSISEALSLITSQAFALYIIDNRLPDGKGIELCRQIRTTDSKTPIIFYSAEAQAEYQQAVFAAGVQAFVIKPDLANELEEAMGYLLRA